MTQSNDVQTPYKSEIKRWIIYPLKGKYRSSPAPPTLRTVKHKLLPGCLVQLDRRTELYGMFTKANLEPILFFKNRKILTNLVNEFYNNLQVRKGAYDLTSLTIVVNRRSILLDHIELGKALKLSDKVLNLANNDISKEFVFIKSEYKIYLSVLCDIEIPHDMFNEDNGISYEHFTHTFQNLALIIRANIFPNTSSDKLMRSNRTIIPMASFGELPMTNLDPIVFTSVTTLAPVVPSSQISFEKEFAKLKEAHEELDAMFQSLQDAYKKVVEKVQVTEAKVGVLVDIMSNTVSRAGKIEDKLSQFINVQLGMIDIPLLPLMSKLENSPVIGVVSDEPVKNGENAMKTDLLDNTIINNPAFETMD
ncbi:hypothetical protein AgCh_001143 [Apium graveolens]